MSAIGGMLSFGERIVNERLLSSLSQALQRRGPDRNHVFSALNFRCINYEFNTSGISGIDRPVETNSGIIAMIDGRLDERKELLALLATEISEIRGRCCERCQGQLSSPPPNSAIVLAAFRRWGAQLIDHLTGDYFFSIVDTVQKQVVLGRDIAGVRPGYYCRDNGGAAIWSSDLLPLADACQRDCRFDRLFVAGYLTLSEPWERTPFLNVRAVRPGECLILAEEGCYSTISNMNPDMSLSLSCDREYEERYLELFTRAVLRRCSPNSATTCELSGGLDSSSIACLSVQREASLRRGATLQTVSYIYDKSVTSDESKYVYAVDAHTGLRTHFIEDDCILKPAEHYGAAPNPQQLFSSSFSQLAAFMRSSNSRTLLSGHAGDQVHFGIGAMLSVLPEYLRAKGVRSTLDLVRQQAKESQRPYLQLLIRCLAVQFLPASVNALMDTDYILLPDWIDQRLVRDTDLGRRKVCQPQAQTIKNVLRRQRYNLVVNAISLSGGCFYRERELIEVAYPYLDGDLVKFLLAIPIDQQVRPAESSRSLMRRSLRGILPESIRTRLSKQGPDEAITRAIRREWLSLSNIFKNSYSAEFGYIDHKKFSEELSRARFGVSANRAFLVRALSLEFWLRGWLGQR